MNKANLFEIPLCENYNELDFLFGFCSVTKPAR